MYICNNCIETSPNVCTGKPCICNACRERLHVAMLHYTVDQDIFASNISLANFSCSLNFVARLFLAIKIGLD